MLTYTQQQRALIGQAFKAAKPYLSKGDSKSGRIEGSKSKYICYALLRARHAEVITDEATLLARRLIMNRLISFPSLEAWLINQGVPKKEMTLKRMQAHRHAWLDQLIQEFPAP